MPVRSLNSSVLKWPDLSHVDQAVRQWAEKAVKQKRNIIRIGYFGSYAQGNWGVGSDLDIIVIVKDSDLPFEKRTSEWDTNELPVPVDLIIYTQTEWDSLDPNSRFYQMMQNETTWVFK